MINLFLSSLRFIFIDLIGDFLYWPVWWYTVGFKERVIWYLGEIKKTWTSMALPLWLKSMFKPMYADRTFMGRAISLVMRILILIWKLIWFCLWLLIISLVLILWLIAPLFTLYMIVQQLK